MRHAKKWLAWLLAILMIATSSPMALAADNLDAAQNSVSGTGTSASDTNGTGTSEDGTGGSGTSEDGTDGTGISENGTGGTGTSEDGTDGTGISENGTGGTGISEDGTGGTGTSEDGTDGTGISEDGTGGTDISEDGTGGTGTSEDGIGGTGTSEDGIGGTGTSEDGTGGTSTSEDGTDGTGTSNGTNGFPVTPNPEGNQTDYDTMETSLLPLTQKNITADLSGYALPELTMVKLSDIFKAANETIPSEAIIEWKGRSGDSYKGLALNDTVDLLKDSNYLDLDDTSATFEAIVGDGNQTNPANTNYTITVQLNVNWLTAEIYTQDKNGTRKAVQQTEVDGYSSSGSDYFYYTIGVSGNSLDDSSEIYLGIGSSGTGANRYDTVKVYEGTYENQGEDITGKIWSQQMGKKDAGYLLPRSYTRFTVVLLKSGTVVGHCDFYLMVEQEMSIYPYLYDTDTSSNASIYSLSRKSYEDSNGKGYQITATLREKFSDSKKFPLRISYRPNGMSANNDLIKNAKSAAGADITSSLMSASNGTGYSVGFGETQFTLFTIDGEEIHVKFILINGNGEVSDNINFSLYQVKDSSGNQVSLHSVVNDNDSNDRYLTYLIENENIDLMNATVWFTVRGSDNSNLPRVYADFGEGPKEQTSGQGSGNFSKTVHYTVASSVDNSLSEEYWVTLVKKSSGGAKLFVNGVDDTNKATRELFLNDYAGYYHDIFIANVGSSNLTGLKAELSATNVMLDEYWTVGGANNDTLAPFSNLTNNEGNGIAKIRIVPKDPIDGDGTISGTLTISADGQTPVVITLTGVAGDPRITNDKIPDGVLYVPYGSMVQTNIMYDWISSTTSLASGDLPDGMVVKPNGEIYGVPKETGNFPITVQLRCSGTAPNGSYYSFPTSTADFTLVIKENTDVNVDGSTDGGYTLQVEVPRQNTTIADHEFKSEGEYGKFVDFWMDGVKLTDGVDYKSEEGSTKITIYRQTFQEHNATGRHTIAAEFREGGKADLNSELRKTAQNYYIGRSTSSGGNNNSGNTGGGSSSRDRDRDTSSSSSPSSSTTSTATPEQVTMTIFNQPFSVAVPRNAATYFVRPGDTLSQIAQNYYGSYLLYQALYEANAETLAKTNGVLYVGMILILPSHLNGVPRLATPVLAAGESMYTIKAGDTLSQIAADVYGDASQYVAIYQRNRDRIADPNLIYVGQNIVLPVITSQTQEPQQVTTSVAGAYAYTVKEGDTLRSIAKAIFNDEKKWKAIYKENQDKIEDSDEIYPGQILTIPTK